MTPTLPRPTPTQLAWIVACCCGVAPLFASQLLPLVDLPQHLHLISVLHRLDDASTLFPEVFERRVQLTPYLGYYYLVSWLSWLLPLETANRVFLAGYVVGLPLSLGFLLRSLKRPAWPALLALPFAYGDSFGWGFLNYCSALPLAFLTCGFFVRAIEDAPKRRTWAVALGFSLVAVLLFHVQVFAWLGVALPFLLLTTPAPEDPRGDGERRLIDFYLQAKTRYFANPRQTLKEAVRARLPALLGVVPGVALFIAWIGLRVGEPAEIAPGQPWKSWGPMLSKENLAWKSFEQNRDEFLPMLGNLLRDGSDALAPKVALGLAALAVVLAFVFGRENREGPLARWRIVGLAGLGVLLYFALPFDIRGYMYYLNTRYAHLAAALLVVCVPPVKTERAQQLVWLGVVVGALTAWPLVRGFSDFDGESRALVNLGDDGADKARVMGIIADPGSRFMTHPVYLHASTVVARARGGLTNFSFALTPHSPLKYRGEPPPTFPSEWDPRPWAQYAHAYDHFVIRGVHPSQLFGQKLEQEFFIAGQRGDFFLVRRR